MKRKNLFNIFLGVFILFLILGGVFIYLARPGFGVKKNEILHVQEIPVLFEITDQKIVGINADTDALKYGTVMKGNTGKREITIVNPFNVDVNVKISFSEDIAEYMELDFDDFNLYGFDDSLKFPVRLVTKDAELGLYNGSMRVVMRGI